MKQIFVEGIVSLLVSTLAIAASVEALSTSTTTQALDLVPFQEKLNAQEQLLDQTIEVGDKSHTRSDGYAI
ncbi:MAG: hypothetical protein AAF921_23245 [Cyanobacteria bacterium P01_D01_bin.44]